jgi:hypothetical protein
LFVALVKEARIGHDKRSNRLRAKRRPQAAERSSQTVGEQDNSMPTSDHYRKSADDCRRHAKEAHDTLERETLMRMAAQWERLAQHKARKESEEA